MKTPLLILALASTLCLTGCDKDRKCGGQSKPPSSDTKKVPDAPSGLQLSAIASTCILTYSVCTRKEKVT